MVFYLFFFSIYNIIISCEVQASTLYRGNGRAEGKRLLLVREDALYNAEGGYALLLRIHIILCVEIGRGA